MKKLFLSLYLISLVTFLGFTQNLALVHDGAPVPNGGAVTYTGEPSTPLIEAHIGIVNTGSAALDVMCKKEVIFLVPNSVNTFCWDNCYPPNIFVSMDPVNIGAGETNTTNFIGEYQPVNNPGQSVIRYTFFVEGNSNDSVSFRAFYNAYPLGTEEEATVVSLSNAYPNPAANQTSFTVSGTQGSTVSLVIRSMLGSTVYTIATPTDGTYSVSTRDLAEGIYFYSLVVDGKISITRKLVIAH